jgi:Flp pilus assembly protein TadB
MEGAVDETGLLNRVPTPVLYALAAAAILIVLAGLFVAIALAEGGALLMALVPALGLCLLRLELRERARRRKPGAV